MEIPDENEPKPFNFEGAKNLSVSRFERVRWLKEVEKFLAFFYGDDHVNWHEMCLDAKKFLEQEIVKHQRMPPDQSEKQEIIRLAIHHILGAYEKVA